MQEQEGGDAAAPSVQTIVVQNERGTEDVQLLAGGADGARLAQAIEAAFNDVLKEHMRRPEFSGHIQVVVLETTPRSERRHVPPVIERLRGICAELTTKEGRYQVSATYQTSSSPATATAGGRTVPLWLKMGVALVLFGGISYWWYTASRPFTFPDTVDYDEQHLKKATSWTRDGISGAVFVAEGERLSTAPLQLGVMISTSFTTADALDGWIREQYAKSRTQTYYDSGAGEEECKVGVTSTREDVRAFMAVQVCRSGGGRAACAEDDEPVPEIVLTPCITSIRTESCFESACDSRLREDRAGLGALVGKILATK